MDFVFGFDLLLNRSENICWQVRLDFISIFVSSLFKSNKSNSQIRVIGRDYMPFRQNNDDIFNAKWFAETNKQKGSMIKSIELIYSLFKSNRSTFVVCISSSVVVLLYRNKRWRGINQIKTHHKIRKKKNYFHFNQFVCASASWTFASKIDLNRRLFFALDVNYSHVECSQKKKAK